MTTRADVRAALASAVSTVVSCRPYQSRTILAASADVGIGAFDPRLVLGGSKTSYPFKVNLYVDGNNEELAQKTLERWTATSGTGSVVAAIEDESNWLVDVDYAQVTNISAIDFVESPSGVTFMYQVLDVEIPF